MVMVLMLLVGSLLVAAVRAVALERRAVAAHRSAVQADFLAEAGLRRGRRWAADPAFTTRVWAVPAGELDGDPATVTVTVDRDAGTLRSVARLTGGPFGDVARADLTAPLPPAGGVPDRTPADGEPVPTRTPLEAPR